MRTAAILPLVLVSFVRCEDFSRSPRINDAEKERMVVSAPVGLELSSSESEPVSAAAAPRVFSANSCPTVPRLVKKDVEISESRLPDGSPAERYYFYRDEDGVEIAHGRFTTWHENGQKSSEGYYDYGALTGRFTEWYANGRKRSERNYVDGTLTGMSATWYENGSRESEAYYADGVEEGSFNAWYLNGSLKMQGTMRGGRLVGEVLVWNDEGEEQGRLIIKDAQ